MPVGPEQPTGRARGRRDQDYTGRHASPRSKTARKRAGKVVPAAAVAATLAAGAAAYILVRDRPAAGVAAERGADRSLSAANASSGDRRAATPGRPAAALIKATPQASSAAASRAAKHTAAAKRQPRARRRPARPRSTPPPPATSATASATHASRRDR